MKLSSKSLESKMNFRNFSSIAQKLLSCLSMIDKIIWYLQGKDSRKMENENNLIIRLSSCRRLVLCHWKYHVFKETLNLCTSVLDWIQHLPRVILFWSVGEFFHKGTVQPPDAVYVGRRSFRALHGSLSVLGLQQMCYFAEEYLLIMSNTILSA